MRRQHPQVLSAIQQIHPRQSDQRKHHEEHTQPHRQRFRERWGGGKPRVDLHVHIQACCGQRGHIFRSVLDLGVNAGDLRAQIIFSLRGMLADGYLSTVCSNRNIDQCVVGKRSDLRFLQAQ